MASPALPSQPGDLSGASDERARRSHDTRDDSDGEQENQRRDDRYASSNQQGADSPPRLGSLFTGLFSVTLKIFFWPAKRY